MIRGIGVDAVNIGEIKRYIQDDFFGSAYVRRTFTPNEVLASSGAACPGTYYAARFAAKEAVFKAVASLTKSKSFDFRIVETLNEDDGKPYININNELRVLLDEASVQTLHISITTEGEYAIAFVVAC